MSHAALGRPCGASLTHAEVRALAELATGSTFDVAARRLDVSDRTIRRRVRDVCDRVGVDTTIQAIVWAAKQRLI